MLTLFFMLHFAVVFTLRNISPRKKEFDQDISQSQTNHHQEGSEEHVSKLKSTC